MWGLSEKAGCSLEAEKDMEIADHHSGGNRFLAAALAISPVLR
jgi:hypothetical protein